ncbi:MAG: alpha/beta fold hydrolase [Eubacteriales bacterium]|nr:alpha/beta fold hydrolase [Eubacteriales bacterium]
MNKIIQYLSQDGMHYIHAEIRVPSGKPKGIVQIVHGMAEHIGRYEAFMNFLTHQGYVVCGNDHLGHGQTEKEAFGNFGQPDAANILVKDVRQLSRIVEQMFPQLPFFLFGHSMGSFIAKDYVVRYPADRLILSGTGEMRSLAILGDAIGYWTGEIAGEGADSPVINTMMKGLNLKAWLQSRRFDTPYAWVSSIPAEAKAYGEDPYCAFNLNNDALRDLFKLAARTSGPGWYQRVPKTLPILIVGGKDDPVGLFGTAVMRVKRRLAEAGVTDVTCKLYDGNRHEVLHDTAGEDFMMCVADFIAQDA